MSRRETTINVLIGSFLVLTFSLIVATGFLALRLAIYLLDLFAAHFLPGVVVREDIAFGAILAGFLLIDIIYAVRWYRWREAFLKFTAISGFGLIATIDLRFRNSADIFWVLWPALLFGSTPRESLNRKDMDRPQFFLGLTTLSALFAVKAGLLGSGLIRQIISGSTYTALLVWFAIRARRGWEKENDEPEPSSASAV